MSSSRIGHFRIVQELGRGGMGVVYKALDESLDRTVAIKVLSDSLASQPEVVARFQREARAMAALSDRHIVQVFYIGEHEGKPYFAMEFIDGEALGDRIKRDGKLTVPEARRILIEAAEGLAVAHARNMVHRDVKPGNLLLDQQGKVKIADFGIAMQHDYSDRLTRTGEFVGTPGYLSPEVCMGKVVDARSDIFSLGVVFYEMLTGELPFNDASPLGLMLAVVRADIPDVRTINADVDDDSVAILTRMLAKDRDERYPDCRALLHALRANDSDTDFVASVPPVPDKGRTDTGAEPSVKVPAPPAPPPATPPAPAAEETMVMPTPVPASPSRSTSLVPQGKTLRTPRWIWPSLAAAILLVAGGTVLALKNPFADKPSTSDAVGGVRLAATTAAQAMPESSNSDVETGDGAGDGMSATQQSGNLESSGAPGADPLPLAEAESFVPVTAEGETVVAEKDRSNLPQLSAKDAKRLALAALDPVSAGETESAVVNISDDLAEAQQVTEESLANVSAPSVIAPSASANSAALPSVESATSQQVRSAPPPPDPYRVLILTHGDPAIGDEVEQVLQDRLGGRPLELVDPSFVAGLDSVYGARGIDMTALRDIALESGIGTAVVAEITFVGETELHYYGERSIMYTVNLEVKAVDLDQRRTLPGGWREQIQFTSLNAADKARMAVDPYVRTLANELRAEG